MSSGEPIYTFIHIPKCGGTSVEKYFESHYSDRIIGTTHKWLCEKDNNPIVIIRNPIDRFISLYHYWKYGSHGLNSRGTEFTEKYGNCSIKEFTKIFKRNVDAIKNNYIHELVSGYMWRIHYFPQVYWIPPDFFENAIVIKYTENLDEKIHTLLDYLHIPDKNISLEKSNVTRTKEGEQAVLDDEDIIWLQEHFREDFELWNAVNETPERFKYVL